MVCATTSDIEEGHACIVSPLKWKSQKQERAVSSTLAAELLTMSKGVAEATWIRGFFLEAQDENFELEGRRKQEQDTSHCSDRQRAFGSLCMTRSTVIMGYVKTKDWQ